MPWPAAGAILPHALRVTDTTTHHDDKLAVIHGKVGQYLLGRAEFAPARTALERALTTFETVYGQDHPEVARTLTNLGIVLVELGDLPGARAVLERALRIKEAVYGQDHPEAAHTLTNLGNVLRGLGDLPRARAVLERASRVFVETLGVDHPHTQAARRALAALGDS